MEKRAMDELFNNGSMDTREDGNYNRSELLMGIEVESEHTNCPLKAKIIAKDHLDEIPDYYTRLKKMEDEAKKELGIDDNGETDEFEEVDNELFDEDGLSIWDAINGD
jgi:hypothetical protein